MLDDAIERAEQVAEDICNLVDLRKTKLEGQLADLKLAAIRIQNIVSSRKISDAAVDEIDAAAVDLKNDIRNAICEVAEGIRHLEDTLSSLAALPLSDDLGRKL